MRAIAQPAIQVNLFSAYQLYLNGMPIGSEGNLHNGNTSLDAIRSYPVSNERFAPGPATLALRITDRNTASINGNIPRLFLASPLQLRAGDAVLLDGLRARTRLARNSPYTIPAICFGIIGVLAFLFLGLFLFDRDRYEFLLLSVTCLSHAILRLNEFAAASLVNYSVSTCLAIATTSTIAETLAQITFYFAIARRRVPSAIFILLIILPVTYIPSGVNVLLASNQFAWTGLVNNVYFRPLIMLDHLALSFAPFLAFWPFAGIPRRMRLLALLCMLWTAFDTIWWLENATIYFPILGTLGVPNVSLRSYLVMLDARGFAIAGVLVALLVLLFREQRKVTLERALLAGEMQAARSVQQYLIPENLPSTPGLSIQSEYRPSREVGGDFFQVLPQMDGSTLIVIGDVSGKGIEAGMLATLIVGAIRTAAVFTADPERILALLNERLRGRGLVTCLALRIEPDGNAALVNAGHLPPYLNGIELKVEGALPLGAAPGIRFPVSQFQLAEGDNLLLMTDGVAEAQNVQGQLFGFERIAELLDGGAGGAALAEAAQNFGQQDDITVLTITRLAAGKEPAQGTSAQILAQA
jgi:hypothetical protein